VALDPVRFAPRDGAERMLELVIAPLGPGPAPLGVSIAVDDVTGYADLEAENEHRGSELEQAYAELHSTIDELETANEELRAANDELETMNEELESTNEELETMNQGLRSATEDVTAINDALRDCTGDLDRVNHALDAILSSLEVGVAVLDRSQRVQVWNRGAEDLWGLRPEQALEQPLLSLDVGLPSERFAPALRAVLGGTSDGEEVPLDGVNRRGRPFVCVTRIVPLAGDGDAAVRGAVVLMERADGGAARTPAAGKGS
jgi:two-component system CheB/CheR fusion protein